MQFPRRQIFDFYPQTQSKPQEKGRRMLGSIGREAIAITNKLRTNPKSFVPLLEEMKNWFEDTKMFVPNLDYSIQTKEGRSVIEETIDFLN